MSNSVTPWTAACQASLSITIFWSLLELMSIESVMPSNHLILCCPLPLLPSIFPSIRVERVAVPFSRESSQPSDWTQVSCIAGRFFTIWVTREDQRVNRYAIKLICQFHPPPILKAVFSPCLSNQSILKGISPGISLEGMMLKLKLQYFGHLMRRVDSLEKTLMLGGMGAGGEGDNRGWDGWMASLTRWTWVSVNSGSCWWTGRPSMLRFMGSQRVGQNWATDLIWPDLIVSFVVQKLLILIRSHLFIFAFISNILGDGS